MQVDFRRKISQRELGRYVKKVGNALLFSDGGERVSLLYVSIAFGGWSGSTLNLKTSADATRSGLIWQVGTEVKLLVVKLGVEYMQILDTSRMSGKLSVYF